jgi:hypothetical protein
MGDGEGGALQQLQLRRNLHHHGRTGQGRHGLGAIAAAQGDHQLGIEVAAGLGDAGEHLQLLVLDRAEGGVDQRFAVELVPGEGHRRPTGRIHQRPGEVEPSGQLTPGVFEGGGLLADLGQRRPGLAAVCEHGQVVLRSVVDHHLGDRSGQPGEQPVAEAVTQPGPGRRVVAPAGVHRRHGRFTVEQQGAAHTDKRQIEGIGHRAPTKGGLINEKGLHPLAAQGWGRLPQQHGGGALEMVDRGAEGCRTAQFTKTVEQLPGAAGGIVGASNRHELQPGSPHPLFRIGDADQAHPVAALAQRMAQGGHRVEMPAGSGTEQAEVGQGRVMGRLDKPDRLCRGLGSRSGTGSGFGIVDTICSRVMSIDVVRLRE